MVVLYVLSSDHTSVRFAMPQAIARTQSSTVRWATKMSHTNSNCMKLLEQAQACERIPNDFQRLPIIST